jgi:hypothetical protein
MKARNILRFSTSLPRFPQEILWAFSLIADFSRKALGRVHTPMCLCLPVKPVWKDIENRIELHGVRVS